MVDAGWVDYSGAAPILLPMSVLAHWRGFYLRAAPDEGCPDLELPEGDFVICDDFDFAHPKTDYDRACALGGTLAAQVLPVGPGHGLVLATELDRLTWRPESLMVTARQRLPARLVRPGDRRGCRPGPTHPVACRCHAGAIARLLLGVRPGAVPAGGLRYRWRRAV